MEIEAITFDAGGTLIEPWPSVGAVYAEVARAFGLECSAERLTAQFKDAWTLQTAFRYTRSEWAGVVRRTFSGLGHVSDELFTAIYERFSEARSWLIYDDVIPTLQTLERMGLKLAVVSNWDDRLEPLLQELGLAAYFRKILMSSVVGAHKPDARIFHRASEALSVAPKKILHVGDSWLEDFEGARRAGMNAARIRRSGAERGGDVETLGRLINLLE